MLIIQPEPEFDYEGAHAPAWQQLRDWMSHASHAIRAAPAMLTRADMPPIKRWLFLLEAMLRRLVLLAAITLKLDIVPRWSRAPRNTGSIPPKPKHQKAANPNAFRLFSVTWPKPPPRPSIILLDAPPPVRKQRPPILTRAFFTWQSDTLLRAGAKSAPATAPTHTLTRRPNDLPRERPEPIDADLLPHGQREIFFPPQLLKQTAGRPPGMPLQTPPMALETKAEPATLPREAMVERFLAIVKLIAKPQPLIDRAARAMARCREIAMRLGDARPPRPNARMRALIHPFSSTLIPLHLAATRALIHFAASYHDPDTS